MFSKLLYLLLFFCLSAAALAGDTRINPSKGCRGNPAVIGNCFHIRGKISIHDGAPSVRIVWKDSRLLGVLPSENEIMPQSLKSAIKPGKDVWADMVVCPFSRREPDQVQHVCVESAKNIRIAERTYK
jgi:hypothetical protein